MAQMIQNFAVDYRDFKIAKCLSKMTIELYMRAQPHKTELDLKGK